MENIKYLIEKIPSIINENNLIILFVLFFIMCSSMISLNNFGVMM